MSIAGISTFETNAKVKVDCITDNSLPIKIVVVALSALMGIVVGMGSSYLICTVYKVPFEKLFYYLLGSGTIGACFIVVMVASAFYQTKKIYDFKKEVGSYLEKHPNLCDHTLNPANNNPRDGIALQNTTFVMYTNDQENWSNGEKVTYAIVYDNRTPKKIILYENNRLSKANSGLRHIKNQVRIVAYL